MSALAVIFVSALVIAYSGAMMPGPMLTVVVTESPRRGWTAGPLVVFGHALLELSMLVLLVVGLGELLESNSVQTAAKLGGGAMLLWMAASMIAAVWRNTVTLDLSDGGGAHHEPIVGGIVSSLSNPYWLIWWATIGMGLLTKSYQAGVFGLLAFYVGHITGDLTWYTAVSGAIAAGRKFISLHTYKVMLVASAGFLVALAGWFVTSALT